MTDTGFLYDPVCLAHRTGRGHEERPERLRAILRRLQASGLLERLDAIAPAPATRPQIELVHEPAYINQVERDIQSGREMLSTDLKRDTHISPASLDAAVMAAGAVLTAVDAVMAGQVQNAFCCIRPPGHHAARAAGMGYCIFNNVAIGVRYAQRWVRRVAIIDWDIHHANGTQDIFEADPSVFLIDSHQFGCGFYPGTGAATERGVGKGIGATLNMPLAPYTTEDEFLDQWQRNLPAAMERFRPEFVFISAGFDAHKDDLHGRLRRQQMTADGFATLTRLALAVAREYAGGRLVSALEGGYDLQSLAESVESHLRVLSGSSVTASVRRTVPRERP